VTSKPPSLQPDNFNLLTHIPTNENPGSTRVEQRESLHQGSVVVEAQASSEARHSSVALA
jgi:hypothetical protein